MFYFWITLMTLLALGILGRNLLQGSRRRDTETSGTSLAIYKQRLQELETEQQQGVITAEQEQAARAEMERALLAEIDSTVTNPGHSKAPAGSSRDWLNAAIIAVLLPVTAGFTYYKLGVPGLIPVLNSLSGQHAASDTAHDTSPASVTAMINALEQRLESRPDDVEGFMLLARSYMSLQKYPEAADAYRRVLAITGDRPDVLLPYADALAMADNGAISGLPEELVHRALQLDPQNPTGLWLAGLAAFEQERYETALDSWRILKPMLEPGSRDMEEIDKLINSAAAALGQPVAAPAPPAAAQQQKDASQSGNTVNVSVSLAPETASMVKPDQAVFIYAQPINGPPMPVAVVRKQVSDLPMEVLLDDSMAMMPTHKLSDFKQVKISARVSLSGNASPESGDLVAADVLVDVANNSETVALQINQQLP